MSGKVSTIMDAIDTMLDMLMRHSRRLKRLEALESEMFRIRQWGSSVNAKLDQTANGDPLE